MIENLDINDIQFNVVVATKDGGQLNSRSRIGRLVGNFLSDDFTFEAPLADVGTFICRKHPIFTTTINDVSLQVDNQKISAN